MSHRYSIGEFAEMTGVSSKALRYYDEINLLQPSYVDPLTGYRYYDAEQLTRITLIRALRSLGMSTEELRPLVAKERDRNSRAALEAFRNRLQESIAMASRTLSRLDAELDRGGDLRGLSIITKREPDMYIASLRATVKTYEEIAPMERELDAAVPVSARGRTHGVLWHRCADSGRLEGEAFIQLKPGSSTGSTCEVRIVPGAEVASCFSSSDDEDSELSYKALNQWMNLHKYKLAGPKREIAVGELLEIQFPIASA
jgi:DNA-binding transcriptional MerR regulator